ncbi:MAG: ABC transporter substrate-binding protein [Planctomycetota bacterium]
MRIPQRIICLCPSITEALFEIGAGDRVVGVTDYCIHPRDRVEMLPKVGGSKLPDLEALFLLKPDLVIMNEEENRIEDYEEIEARGIPIVNTFPKKVMDTAPMMRVVGRAVGCESAAEKVALEIESAVAAAERSADSTVNGNTKLKTICLLWKNPFMTINRDTFMHDMIELCGFDNLYSEKTERYPKITKEDFQTLKNERGLDCILLPNEPFEFVPQHATEISAMAGLPTARAVLCDGQYLTWYGSRTAAGIQYTLKLAARVRAMQR